MLARCTAYGWVTIESCTKSATGNSSSSSSGSVTAKRCTAKWRTANEQNWSTRGKIEVCGYVESSRLWQRSHRGDQEWKGRCGVGADRRLTHDRGGRRPHRHLGSSKD